MTNTKAWIGAGVAGIACYFAPEAIEYVSSLLGSSTRLTPNSESDWHMLKHVGEWVMAGGAIGTLGSLAGKITDNPKRKIGIEGMVDTGLAAAFVDTKAFREMLYHIDAYTPSMQSKLDFGAKVAFAAFLVAFAYSFAKKEEPKKK
ncbi:MAG: hypothetical protein PHO02_07230 [Candidatus Nanoarchaeia archaeon]|nr:hypothetical protein [Candidatus Nanoarchaeia archaeon]